MKSKIIRIGSRGSDLALWQAHYFQDQMKAIGVQTEIVIITTKGDRIQHLSFDKIEGKGFFTKEIEEALIRKKVDVAIHSHKDLETQAPPGLQIAGVSYREDPSELLLIHPDAVDMSMPFHFKKGAIIGTSSARRKGQIKAFRPDIQIKDIRGNVPTRINKLRSGDFDAILLAYAGVHRLDLDLSDLRVEKLDPRLFIPAPAQGVLAFQCREDDDETANIIKKIHDTKTARGIEIERNILSKFGGGCQIPIGVYAESQGDAWDVRVSYASAWQDFCHRVRFPAENTKEASSTFSKIKASEFPKKVFISRDLSDNNYFKRAAEAHGMELTSKAMISVNPVSFDVDHEQVDVVFFASSNAVNAFFNQENPEKWKQKRFAATGSATAQTLANYVDSISFVGEGSDMGTVGKAFSNQVASDDHVLFPVSNRSLRSIEGFLKKEQCLTVVSYETVSASHEVEECDAYVFTSPSNVSSFFEENKQLPPEATIVSIGTSTAKTLKDMGYKPKIAAIPDDAELFALLAN